jgi:hypothetical protein
MFFGSVKASIPDRSLQPVCVSLGLANLTSFTVPQSQRRPPRDRCVEKVYPVLETLATDGLRLLSMLVLGLREIAPTILARGEVIDAPTSFHVRSLHKLAL